MLVSISFQRFGAIIEKALSPIQKEVERGGKKSGVKSLGEEGVRLGKCNGFKSVGKREAFKHFIDTPLLSVLTKDES